MRFGIRRQKESDVVPLHGAVLCVDCECITASLSDECLVCGSHSLFNLERMLGGTQLTPTTKRSEIAPDIVLLNAEIAIDLKEIEPRELNAVVEGITNVIGPRLGRGRAWFHINVEPETDRCDANVAKAA